MMQLFLIGGGAGIAAALLFASVATGSPLSVLLFYLAPLPILIAAMGWSHWAALIAAVVAAASIGSLFGTTLLAAFLIGIGLPAWWLGYLSLLARPTTDGLEWYPVGHLVFWTAIISGVVVTLGMLTLGANEESFRAALRKGLEHALEAENLSEQGSNGRRLDWVVNVMVAVMPMAAGVLTTITGIFNLGLAAQIVSLSGRLPRPWPELSAMQFPPFAPAVIAAAFAGSFISGMVGLAAGALMASLLVAYAVLGFAVLHAISRGWSGRPFVLGGAYAAVIVLFWPAILLTLLGLADALFNLRGRAGKPSRPNT